MTIGEIIKEYRDHQQMSQRRFAAKCGVSNTFIHQLEVYSQEENNAFIPTIPKLKLLANGMDMSLDDLFRKLDDDMIIQINSKSIDDEVEKEKTVRPYAPDSLGEISVEEEVLINVYRLKPDYIKDAIWRLLDFPKPRS